MLKRPVVGALGVGRKTAGRKLPAIQMITEAVTAFALALARLITAITGFQDFFLFTFHQALLAIFSYMSNEIKIHENSPMSAIFEFSRQCQRTSFILNNQLKT